jgi:hypothetical protein
MRKLGLIAIPLLLVGCTTASKTTSSAPPPKTVVAAQQTSPTGRYSGYVWTWDAERNIVTFWDFDRAKIFRVQTTADQIKLLTMHSNGSVTGQLLAPDEITTTTK